MRKRQEDSFRNLSNPNESMGKARQSSSRWVRVLASLTKLSNPPVWKHNTAVWVCDHHHTRSLLLHRGGRIVSPNIFIHPGKHGWHHCVHDITTNHMAISSSSEKLISRMSLSLWGRLCSLSHCHCGRQSGSALLSNNLSRVTVLEVTAVYAEEDSRGYSGSLACLDEEFFDVVFWDYHHVVTLIRAGIHLKRMMVPLQN